MARPNQTIIVIVGTLVSAISDAGANGVAYIEAILSDSFLAMRKWNEDDVKDLCKELTERCFEKDIGKLVLAMQQWHDDHGTRYIQTDKKVNMITMLWESAFRLLEPTEVKDINYSTFTSACYVWMNCDRRNKGRVMSFIRRTMEEIGSKNRKQISEFAATLENCTGDACELQHHLCAAMLEKLADPVKFWSQVEDAFIGKFNGFEDWRRAQEIVGEVRIMNKCSGSIEGVKLYEERIEELRKLMNDVDRETAEEWLQGKIYKNA